MKKFLIILLLSQLVTACIYPYTPDLKEAPEKVLTVDANISVGEASTVRLGTLTPVYPDSDYTPTDLSGAKVWVEDDAGTVYPGTSAKSYYGYAVDYYFRDISPIFTIDTENAPADRRYRLVIEALGNTYVTDWNTLSKAPEVKDIEFKADDYSVFVYVTVDGGEDATGYMLLSYDETWEFHVDYLPMYDYNPEYGFITELEQIDQSKYWCWRYHDNMRTIPINYTALSGSGITGYRLYSFARSDNRNHRRYCTNIKAKSLSRETYRFLYNLETNTNGGDNLFTPNPGDIPSNLRCETDPEKSVLGYAIFSRTFSKRGWLDSRYQSYSPSYALVYPLKESYLTYWQSGYLPLDKRMPEEVKENEGEYGWGPRTCYDCTAAGGTLEKPAYWNETE